MHFGKQIEAAREAKGWRQEDLAERLEVTQQAVAKWEAQESPPFRSRSLKELCEILGLEPPVLLNPFQTRRHIAQSLFETVSKKPPAPTVMTPSQLIQLLRERLPENLKQFAGGSLATKRLRIVFPYASPRVIAHAIFGSQNGASRTKMRSAAWRMAAAMLGTGDIRPTSHHYLLAALELPGEEGTNTLPEPMAKEGAMAGIITEALPDVEAFISRIVELEQTPTEADEIQELLSQENFDDLI